ncbi:hypothetical protein ILUMI_04107, partial [Ignelater luminosus]
RRTVKRWILRSQLGELDTVRPGAAYVTNADQDNAIVEMTNNSRFISTVRIRKTLQLTCSLKTIRRRLHENGIHNRQPARKMKRYFCRLKKSLSNCGKEMEHGMTSIMFCQEEQAGVLMPVLEIVRVTPPRFNSRQYIRVLDEVLLPSVRAVYAEYEMATFIFVQDNSSIHTAQIVQEWFEEHPEIELLRWPDKSADLNSIENLWAATVRKFDNIEFHRVRERNVEELTRHVTTTWKSFRNSQICDNLVSSMERRLQECINDNGYYCKY